MRQERADLSREALIAAAARCFDQSGYERTTTLDISRAAAMSKGALSFHFDSKVQLATVVQREACAQIQQEAERLSACLNNAPLQALIDLTHLAVDQLVRQSPLVRAAVRLSRELDSPADPDLSPHACWRRVYTYAAQGAEQAEELGNSTAQDAVVLALCLTAGVYEYSASTDLHHCLTTLWQTALTGLAPGSKLRSSGEAWTDVIHLESALAS